MMKGLLFVASLFLLGGIAEGLSNGADLSSALWSIPICLVMYRTSRA